MEGTPRHIHQPQFVKGVSLGSVGNHHFWRGPRCLGCRFTARRESIGDFSSEAGHEAGEAEPWVPELPAGKPLLGAPRRGTERAGGSTLKINIYIYIKTQGFQQEVNDWLNLGDVGNSGYKFWGSLIVSKQFWVSLG